MHGLSKSKVMAHRQCEKRLWLHVNHPELAEISPMGWVNIHNGNRIGEAARTLYPDGLLIDTLDPSEALRLTREALANEPARPLFEGAFEAGGVLIRADVFLPGSGGAEMVEVKGSLSLEDYQREDAAIQAWVIRSSGVPLKSVTVAHANRDFRYAGGGDYQGLLLEQDVTSDAHALAPQVVDWITAARSTLGGPQPEVAVGPHCKDPYECPFRKHCNGQSSQGGYPIEELYRASPKLKQSLKSAGYTDLRDVPRDLLRSDLQARIQDAAISGQPYLDDRAATSLRRAPYPRYYLDFETIRVGCPIWPDTGPGMVIPFQWSCHIEHAAGQVEHREFLAADAGDPRRAFGESLLAVVGTVGPVYAYHASFERLRLKDLAAALPDLADRIDALMARIEDLEVITRDSYYHPDMRGSWSLKNVLPTIAPDLDYANLAVRDGNFAQLAYLEMIDDSTLEDRRQEIRGQLLEYCGRDTEALVRLTEFLEGAHAG